MGPVQKGKLAGCVKQVPWGDKITFFDVIITLFHLDSTALKGSACPLCCPKFLLLLTHLFRGTDSIKRNFLLFCLAALDPISASPSPSFTDYSFPGIKTNKNGQVCEHSTPQMSAMSKRIMIVVLDKIALNVPRPLGGRQVLRQAQGPYWLDEPQLSQTYTREAQLIYSDLFSHFGEKLWASAHQP